MLGACIISGHLLTFTVASTKRSIRRKSILDTAYLNRVDKKGRLLTCRYDRLKELRRMVIVYGLPVEEPEEDVENALTLRGRVWKVLLGMDDDSAASVERKQEYKRTVAKGASSSDGEIRNDTFRTFRGDPSFARRVPEATLVRALNAFLHDHVLHATTTYLDRIPSRKAMTTDNYPRACHAKTADPTATNRS
ncbi:hypothetical protein AaE_000367, partial [Aphanomyces astaci]